MIRLFRRMLSPDSGLSIVPMIAAVMLLGCVTGPPRTDPPRYMTWQTCEGTTRGIMVETRYSSFPPAACIELAAEKAGTLAAILVAFEGHLACTTWDHARTQAIMVLPHDPPEWLVRHETARIIDADATRLRAWGKPRQECVL